MMPRARRQLPVAHGAQVAAQRLLADRHTIFVEQPLDQIDDPPAHHAMRRRDGALFDDLGKRPLVLGTKHWAATGGFAVEQALGPAGIEAQHPVSDRLQTNTADLRRRLPRTTIVNHRQRQQPPNLVGVTAQTRQPAKTSPSKSPRSPTADATANLPQPAMLNQIVAALGIPRCESLPKGLGMTAPLAMLKKKPHERVWPMC
jgi:hypothetical protein